MPDPMETVARCAPSAEAAERILRVATRVTYFDGAGGTMSEGPSLDDLRERGTCSGCLARTYRSEECVCEDGGDAEDVRDEFDARRELGWWR